MPEIVLPGVKLEHLKRAIQFMYTGKLKVTTEAFSRREIPAIVVVVVGYRNRRHSTSKNECCMLSKW